MLKNDTASTESNQRNRARQNEWQRAKRQSSVRVGEGFQCQCGVRLTRKSGSHKVCESCAASLGPSYSRRYRQRNCVPPGEKSGFCVRCATPINWFRSPKKYCDTCRRQLQREKVAARYERFMEGAKGSRRIGVKTTCATCGVEIIRTAPSRCFCSTCRDERTRRRVRINELKFRRGPKRKAWANGYRKQPRIFLSGRMRAGINRSLNYKKNGRSWERLVGYKISELLPHLERQFLPGMTWGNRGQWHIDHIVPLSAFSFTSASNPEFRAAWAMTNLRPLWGSDNLQKRAERTHLI